MKIILSRKGFDSSSGGCPSPIFPNGELLSLPIPDRLSTITYNDIQLGSQLTNSSMGELVTQLTLGKITGDHGVHLDPDLRQEHLPRSPHWQPLFGQMGTAQKHLQNQGVSMGDLFLFFGLFQSVYKVKNEWTWDKKSKPRHVLWGWLQVEDILQIEATKTTTNDWTRYHCHYNHVTAVNNVLYKATPKISINNQTYNIPGAGTFRSLSKNLQLTQPDSTRVTNWQLPSWCYPRSNTVPFSYHSNLKRWQKSNDGTYLSAAARGQEFVMDSKLYPESIDWAKQLLNTNNS